MQSKLHSILEIVTNLSLGLLLSIFVVQPIVFGFYGVEFAHKDNASIAIVFTLVSLIRGYVVRRAFNWYTVKYKTK